MESGQYILVDNPGAAWTTTDKSTIIVRLFGESAYYGFTTYCIGMLRELKLLVLRYPEDIIDSPYRKFSRFDITIPAKIAPEGANDYDKEDGVVVNLSEGGCQLISAKSFDVNDNLFLSIDFPTGSGVDKLSCIARTVNQEDKKFNYGLQFDIINDDELNAIKEFLKQLSEYDVSGELD